ncbi:ATP/GTP-binding protein [Streptomyces sp. MB09-02B]|uniref:ATP/GTP-binding protein n=1 Tax=Streptomyces sp. MB09-02B TaxID=3028667 RepID=UPI0029B9A3DF|nr:ATP/GTP-binding protein [Streptomyces sp. MB09-02B]MDX3640338.1 ATP/GTP-binding protein [Streptomyces sp. MB09-02B]
MRNGQVPAHVEVPTVSRVRSVSLAPLKVGLPPERRALAEDLRRVFLTLGVSVRRYAARRHHDASSVTRYLSGDRVPPWHFVAGVIADVQEARIPLTPEAETALRDLHRAALKTNRRSSEVQVLQDRLAEADEETRRITTRQRALEEALQDREVRLAEVRSRCRHLETRIEEQRLDHRAELAVWHGEYARLEEECGDLQEQVIYLQEALTVTRAELIAAEDRCHRLETQLEITQEADRDQSADGVPPSLMLILEEADRTSSVPDLVRTVGDLELRTRQATASELVRSASQSRTVEEVAGLLAALRQAGFDAHAQTALPAMVMVRSIDDTSALARELFRAGLEEYVLTLVQASVKFHQPEDVAAFALALDRAGLPRFAESLLGAVAVVRPVADMVSVAASLVDGELDSAVGAAMATAAVQRSVTDLVALSIALREACLIRCAEAVRLAVAAERSASDVAEFIRSLSRHGLTEDAEAVFDRTQDRTVSHLMPLIHALWDDRAWTVLHRAAESRSGHDIALLISDLYMVGRHQHAAELLVMTLRRRPAELVQELVGVLVGLTVGSEAVLRAAARTLPPATAAALLVCLERIGLLEQAATIFQSMVHNELAGHAGLFLSTLAQAGSHYGSHEALEQHARTMSVPTLAPLLLALESASLTEHLDAVILASCSDCPFLDVAMLLKRLDFLDSAHDQRIRSVVQRILEHTVHTRSPGNQAALVGALEGLGLHTCAADLTAKATRAHGRRFTEELKQDQNKHEQRFLSRAFWTSERSHGHGEHA